MTLLVPKMKCNGCVSKIKEALDSIRIKCNIKLDTKSVIIDDGQEKEARDKLKSIGFEAN